MTNDEYERLVDLRASLDNGDYAQAEATLRDMIFRAGDDMADRADRNALDGLDPGGCKQCTPFPCDDPDRHLGVDPKYTPLANRGCRCGADFDGRDCMCFESY